MEINYREYMISGMLEIAELILIKEGIYLV